MMGRASALAVLGLHSGADTAAIEQAYKRLIKVHHPDREGGDASRAAEINRAYRELRGGKAATDPLQFNQDLERRRQRRRWPLAALFAIASMAALMLLIGPSTPLARVTSAVRGQMPVRGNGGLRPASGEPMEDRLHVSAIDKAVRDAVRIFHTKDEVALAAASRDCQQRFRNHPGTLLLDSCAAFDDAVVGLQDRDPLRDEGPFAPLAVTGRQWSAASSLSDDDLAIDDRLDQIRLRVEMALAPELTQPQPAEAN